MKKPKVVKPFFFKELSHEEVIDEIDLSMSVRLKKNQDLIDRIYARYNFISKREVIIVVNQVFSSVRSLMVLGNVINLNKVFFDTKLLFFKHLRGGVIFPSLKVKIGTPTVFNKNDSTKS